MAAICQRHGVKVISDDIHMDMSFARYLPWSEVAPDEHWALVSSGSKSFNIPALGGACAFIANAEARAGYLQRLKAAHGLSSPPFSGCWPISAPIAMAVPGSMRLNAICMATSPRWQRGSTLRFPPSTIGCPRNLSRLD